MRRDPTPGELVRYLSFGGYVAMLPMPIRRRDNSLTSKLNRTYACEKDSFACKEILLDRLLQINQRCGFTSGTQLYVYLQRHNCIGLTAGRARVYANKGQYVCIYDPKNKNKAIKPCAWTRREMLLK